MCVQGVVPRCTVRQTPACRHRFSPSTVLGPEVELRLLGLVTSVLTPSPQPPLAILGLFFLPCTIGVH